MCTEKNCHKIEKRFKKRYTQRLSPNFSRPLYGFHACYFCFFFSRIKIWFSRKRFFQNFHGHFGFFTCTFWIFFTHTLDFSRKQLQKFSRKEVRFSQGKKKLILEMRISSIFLFMSGVYGRSIIYNFGLIFHGHLGPVIF